MSATEGKFYETLHKYQSDFVKHKTHDGRRKCAATFRVYIDSESRTKGIEEFTSFLQEINRTLVQLIGSANLPEKLCGIYLLDELIEVPYEENEIKITRFAQYLRMVYDSNDSFNLYLYQTAINVFGHLVRVGGVLVGDLILGEARKSLEFLRGDKPDKNVTALLILKTLAENAPTLFSPYLDSCIDSLWPALHSNNENVRNSALDCLHQCILLVNTRLPAQRDQLYTRINTEILGLFKLNTADAIQGGLRAIALLLIYGGDFLLPYFNKVIELVFQHKEHRDRAVRDTVVMLIPTLIAYSPTSFQAGTQLPSLISHVIAILHKAQHESSISIAYISLGKIALHTGQALLYKLDVIANLVKDGLKKKARTTHSSVLQCLSMLSRALGLALLPYATDLVDLLFEGGLSPALVNTLAELAQNLPVLLPSIQSRLLSAISLILSQVDINNTTITKSTASFLSRAGILMTGGSSSSSSSSSSHGNNNSSSSGSLTSALSSTNTISSSTTLSASNDPNNISSNFFLGGGGGPPGLLNSDEDFDPNSPTGLIALALSTLGQFDFTSHNLLPFVYQRVLPWLNATDSKLRSQTARCCLNIVLRPPSNPLKLHLSHYLQMQDVIFAIQDQVQLQQKLLIAIAGEGATNQLRGGQQEDDEFDPSFFSTPKQWTSNEFSDTNNGSNQQGDSSGNAPPTAGRRTRTGSISVANSRLLTMDIRKSTTTAIKPLNSTTVIPSAPLALRPIPSRDKTTGSLIPRSPTDAESPRNTPRGGTGALSPSGSPGTLLSQGTQQNTTPKALLNVARKLKYKLRDPLSTPRPSLTFSSIQSKDKLMGHLYGHSRTASTQNTPSSAGGGPSSMEKRISTVPLSTQIGISGISLGQLGSNMLGQHQSAGSSGTMATSNYGVDLFNKLLKVQFQVLTQLHVQMELFLSLQRQNFNNSNAFNAGASRPAPNDTAAGMAINEGLGFGKYTGSTATTLAQTLSQDAHQLLAQIQVALLQVQQEQQLVLQAQATGIDMSGLSDSAIFDHLKRHKRRSKRTSIAAITSSPLQQFGPLGGKPIQAPPTNHIDLKHEIDSQILIRAYISSGMAQELGITDLANLHNLGHVSSVQYRNNIAQCVLPDPTLNPIITASKTTSSSSSSSSTGGSGQNGQNGQNSQQSLSHHHDTMGLIMRQNNFGKSSPIGSNIDDYGAVGGVQNLPKGWTIMVNEVLTRLTAITLSDPDPSIRHNVLSLLTPHFDVYLSQPHHLSTLINVLKDPQLENKNMALTILCRLMPLNPILVLPILRHFITEVAYQLQLSGSPKTREESAAILTHIAVHAHTFIKPYAIPIIKVLVRVLLEVQAPSVASGILTSIGEMALVAGVDSYPIVAPILPLLFCIIYNKESHSIQTKGGTTQQTVTTTPGSTAQVTTQSSTVPQSSGSSKSSAATTTTTTTVTTRTQAISSPVLALLQGHTTVIGISHYVALRCLRLICTAGGLVMGPYHIFPGLLSTLIRIVCSTLSTQARNEAVQLIGTIGAVDPFVAKLLHSRTQQLTLREMTGVLIKGVRDLFTTSSMSLALSNIPAGTGSGTGGSGSSSGQSNTQDNSADTSSTSSMANNFLKTTIAMLRGIEVEQSTLDDEILRLFLYSKTVEMEGLLQQIRLQAHTLVGYDNENDGSARTTQVAQDHRYQSEQQFLTFKQNNNLLNPYPGNALVSHNTTVTEQRYDELYHLLNNLSMNNAAGPEVNSDNMYRAYIMYEQQLAANSSDLDMGEDSSTLNGLYSRRNQHIGTLVGEADYETDTTITSNATIHSIGSSSSSSSLTGTTPPTPYTALVEATRRGQAQDQQVQPCGDDLYVELYDLNGLSLSRHTQLHRQTKDPTNAMVQMLTASVAQSNPSGSTTVGLSTNASIAANNLLQLIQLPQPSSEIAPELDIAGTDYYRLIAVHALVDILTDQVQSQSHKKAVIALMFIFKTMGIDCYKLLPHIVPVFAQALSYQNDDLRKMLLEQLGSMALLTTKHFKSYISPILHLILLNWPLVSILPQSVFLLIQRMASVDTNEIQIHMPELLPRLLSILLTDKSPNRNLSQDVLRALQSLVHCLEPYLHMILPALTQVWAIGSDSPLFVRCLSLHTTAQLLRLVQSIQHVPRLVLPLLELIQSSHHITSSTTTGGKNPPLIITANGTTLGSKSEPKPDLMAEVLQTLCVLVYLMGPKYSKHILSTQSLLSMKNIQHHTLQLLFTKILSQIQLTPYDMPQALPLWKNDNVDQIRDLYSTTANPFTLYDDIWVVELGLARNQFIPSNTSATAKPAPKSLLSPTNSSNSGNGNKPTQDVVTTFDKLPVNQTNLIKTWDTSQRLTSDDWTEWMKGVCVGMLKDSPFPPLRACSVLAQKDHQLARNLFTVGFASCWNELNDVYQDAIVNALDQALKSPTTPSDILSALLTLCEFMEHDDRPLPLDIRQLAHLSATKCHSFAKALHYKEQEFYASSNPSLLLEDLISTHNKLQQPQAAIGILKMATSLPEFRGSLQENWYEQLHRWDEALAAYERKQLSEGLLNKDGTTTIDDLHADQLAHLQAMQGRNRFQNGSVLGSIVGQVSSTFSLASSIMQSTDPGHHNQPGGGGGGGGGGGNSPFNTLGGNIRALTQSGGRDLMPNTTSRSNGTLCLGGTVNIDTILGRLRCLKALGDYDRVAKISIDLWNQLQHIALNLEKEVQTIQQNSIFSGLGGSGSGITTGQNESNSLIPAPTPSSAAGTGGRDSFLKQTSLEPRPSEHRSTLSGGSISGGSLSLGNIHSQSVPQHLSYELSVLPDLMSEVASLACEALHMLGKWDDLPPFFNALSPQILDRSFYNAIYHIHTGNLPEAEAHLRNAKKLVQDDIYALLGEGYNRAYSSIVGIQLLTELEEVVIYKRLGGHLSTSSTASSLSSYISHAQSHTHALSLSRMKPMQDTNNVTSHLHNINPFMQSTLSHQLRQQLQSQYSISYDLMSNYTINNHGTINQLVHDHNYAVRLQIQRQKQLQNFGAPRLPPRPSTSAAAGVAHIHHIITPQQHQQTIIEQVSETKLLHNAMYTYFQRYGSFNNARRNNFSTNGGRQNGQSRPIAPANFSITNNSDYMSKPSVTCAAHLTNNTTNWTELLARTQQRALIRTAWNQRLKSVQRNPYVWRHLLATRSLVLTPQQNAKFWIQYTHMTSNMGRFDHSLDILKKLLHRNPHQAPLDYELHLNYLQHDPFLSPKHIENGAAAAARLLNQSSTSTTSGPGTLPALTLNTVTTPRSTSTNQSSTDTHRPRQLMYLPTANTFLQAISVTKPVDAYTQMMCDIFSLQPGSQTVTFSNQQQQTNTVPSSVYQFSFGVSSPFDNMFELLQLSTNDSSNNITDRTGQRNGAETQIKQHFYQQDFFGFNLDLTQHPLLAIGAIAISPVTLANAHHAYMASSPQAQKRAAEVAAQAQAGSQSSRLGPKSSTPNLSSTTALAHHHPDEESEINKAKFHASYMAYPCALDDFLVSLAYCQHLWRVGYRNVALDRLTYLTHVLEYLLQLTPHTHTPLHHDIHGYLTHINSSLNSKIPTAAAATAPSSSSLSPIYTSHNHNHDDYHVHPPGDVVYVKHHRFCPHHPLYHTLSQEEIVLEHKAQHDKEQQAAKNGYLAQNYIPLVCMLSVCPPPQRIKSDDNDNFNKTNLTPTTLSNPSSTKFFPQGTSSSASNSHHSPTILPIPQSTPISKSSIDNSTGDDDFDNEWYPLAPIRATQRTQLTSLASKLNRITGDWGLSILSLISPTFGIHFQGTTDTASNKSKQSNVAGHRSSTIDKNSGGNISNSTGNQTDFELDLSNLPRVSRNIAETFALSATLEAYQRSTLYSPQRYRGWHGWAVIHYRAAQIIRASKQNVSSTLKAAQKQFVQAVNPSTSSSSSSSSTSFSTPNTPNLLSPSSAMITKTNTPPSETQMRQWSQEIHQLLHDYDSLNKHLHLHVVAAITGFLHSVSLARDTSQSLQDLLRLLALWFSHGNITGRKLYLPAPNAILTSTMASTGTAAPGKIISKGSKSLRQQYQDTIGIPPIILGQNKLPSVADVLRQGFNSLPITTWVVVSPQIIARLHSSSAKGTIRVLIQELLLMIGQYHPQALVYPLTVAVKSEQPSLNQTVKQHVLSVALHRGLTLYGPSKSGPKTLLSSQSNLTAINAGVRANAGMVHGPDGTQTGQNTSTTRNKHDLSDIPDGKGGDGLKKPKQHTLNTALQVMSSLRAISPLLIEQAMVVSRELIRAAVLWHEIWHEALEEASRLWFTQQDPLSMLALLLPLHQKIGLGSHSMVQISTAPQTYHIPTGNVISNLVTTLPSFQINSKNASTAGANNYGANIHQNFFSGPETPREIAFIHIFGRELSLAHDWCMKYLSHMAEDELNIDSTQMWYNGEIMGKLKKDLEGYQPGVQFYHPPRHGIQAMNDFLVQQHELNQRAFFARTEDIFSEDTATSSTSPTSSSNNIPTFVPGTALSTIISPANSSVSRSTQSSGSKSLTEKTKTLPYASDLNQAWAIYCTVFRQINKMISQGGESAQFFELHDVSPILLSCQDLVLAIPGTYDPKRHLSTICISRVISHFKIIESKQRPRKLSIIGSDGEEHPFLLKGHEDLRQDTRVMQLFDLVNALLSSSSSSSSTTNNNGANSDGGSTSNSSSNGGSSTSSGGPGGNVGLAAQGSVASGTGGQSNELDLNLRGYSVTPLSPVSGVIQWLSNCDTLHALIKSYRDARFVLISAENKLMGQISANCQTVKILQKVEVFEHALSNTNGRDLADVLWLKASTSEQWLERRNNYTRSLAVTSIVGYILGLGDRHPCNLMIEKSSAKVIHIDFGDCFEVAQHREKFPERVPFRLTRILVRALEVSGIEGTFRLTCEHVMQTLRASKESVMAVLEAFIYDPLITWRLLHDGNAANVPGQVTEDESDEGTENDTTTATNSATQTPNPSATIALKAKATAPKVSPTAQLYIDTIAASIAGTLSDDLNDDNIFNTKALSVIERIESKLNGTDFHGKWNLAIQQRNKRVINDKIKCLLGFGLEISVSQDGFNKHLDDAILSSQEQVELLIQLSTNSQVLASAYTGWCPYL